MTTTISYGNTDKKSWFEDEIQEADVVWELLPDSLRDVDLRENITRGEFADVIDMAFFSVHDGYPFEYVVSNFTDTEKSSANAAFQLGVVTGFPDNTFRENNVITRQEMFKMIQRFMLMHSERYECFDEQIEPILSGFSDQQSISDWAKSGVAVMLREGIVKGTGNQSINPLANASRAEAVILAKRMLIILTINNPETLNVREFTREIEQPTRSISLVEEYNPLTELGYNDAKFQLIFESNGSAFYSSDVQARQFLQSMEVNVWLVDANGNKYPGKKNLLVNKAIVPMVTTIFETIFNGPEKFPIKDVSSYAWRSSSTSEHRYGIAIDINPVENYMIRSDGKILAGSLWQPGTNVYSIPENGDVVNAFKQNGFSWGGNAWSSSKDFMHFSYLGH